MDHHHPPGRGGSPDHADNLVYCCSRCNLYKSDYWPRNAGDLHLTRRATKIA
ncbi:MAG: hypothetical protein EI684_08085 [Candidatus Viridilinea halotolerans]|uniref:HNH domain-containing protein n=1 Tax=Candidatus Viridilinea halotolerans TaxID=2491704 RepID=A0A426U2L5_9CHLR|nr:MAG: hypothetical protein EI684_08085 [Candidatus Viridilinea halotolerans]